MSAPVRQRAVLLGLAAEGIAAAVPGCALAFAQGQRAIDRFGPGLVERWREYLKTLHRARQVAALEQLASLPAALGRTEALESVVRCCPDVATEDRARAGDYLGLLPRTVHRGLVPDPVSGGLTLPSFLTADDPDVLRRLLPRDAPPWPPNGVLDGCPYTPGEVVRADEAGVVYRATAADGSRVALLACLGSVPPREHLERLKKVDEWPASLVRLLDFDLDRRPPWLALDTVPGADLTTLLANLRHQTGRPPADDEVLPLMKGLAEALAALHGLGLAHGDLRPESVLLVGNGVKLGDVAWAPSSQPGASKREDVGRFGLIWYRLLVGDWDAGPGSVKGLELPPQQAALLERCLGPEAPEDGWALLGAFTPGTADSHRAAYAEVSDEEVRAARLRREKLLGELRQLREGWFACEAEEQRIRGFSWRVFLGAAGLSAMASVALLLFTRFNLPALLIIGAGSLVAGLAIERWFNWRERAEVRRMHAALIAWTTRMGQDYPDEVAAWGGADVLRNVEVVREFIAALQLEVGAPG